MGGHPPQQQWSGTRHGAALPGAGGAPGLALLKNFRALLLFALLGAGAQPQHAAAAAPTEHQVKAVFVFNFSHFVAWPPEAFTTPAQPFVICLLGGDELDAQLQEAVAGEHIDGHPLLVRRVDGDDVTGDCQILYIGRAEGTQLERIVALTGRRGTLTVSDLDGAARRGVMIQLANEQNRIRLLINVDAAQAAGLTISSNLLRPAEIVQTRRTQ
jgi:hypothetical protein